MCGIAGFVNLDGAPADASVLDAMTDMIRHRGPDDRGTLCLSLRGGIPDTALGMTTAAIGAQTLGASAPRARADLRTRLMHRYMDTIGRLTTSDPEVRLRLLRAFHMIAPPESLFAPAMLWRAVTSARRPVDGF